MNKLRFAQATTILRVKDDVRPLQVETLRLMQATADQAYTRGLELLRSGRLTVRLSEQEALGNFIDREIRTELRRQYSQYGVNSAGPGPVRVNRRENDSSLNETSFRRPDARVGDVAFDVTLSRKTLKTSQIRGFFNSDFKPRHVIIIRPRQMGPGSSYVITRPEGNR